MLALLVALAAASACGASPDTRASARTVPSTIEPLPRSSTGGPRPPEVASIGAGDDIHRRSDGCVSASIAPDGPAGAPTGQAVPLPGPLLPGEVTGARLLLFSLAWGVERRDAIVDVDRSTVTRLDSDTACGSYYNLASGVFGLLYAPKGFADGRTQYQPRLWLADGSSVTFDLPGNDTSVVLGSTWWGLSSTAETPQLNSVELATGAIAAWGDAPDRSAVLVGHDALGRPVVSTDTLGTFAFDPASRTFAPLSAARTAFTDGVHRIEYDCSSGTCAAVYRSDATPAVELGLAPYLEVTPSPDGRYLLLVSYAELRVPVELLDTDTGQRIHLADEDQGIGPVVRASWSNEGDWLFMVESGGGRRFMAWKPGMSVPQPMAGAGTFLQDVAGFGTLPDA